ncbi:MAG: uracil-DNA glycosylase [Bacteroidales bacterium]|nr:uracil-DNA glycosylase [Bacteroidales bacterium]
MDANIHESWKQILSDEFNKEYFLNLKEFLVEERKTYKTYPAGPNIFHAFNQTPFENVKLVILGQDPYHGTGQAHGLCFSVPFGIKPPPSLVNIFKEIQSDLGLPFPNHGNLEYWAMQGVLLLNATLTVRANQAGSHQNKGWEIFTDTIIKKLSDERENLIFLLWGRFAQNKAELIDREKHFILEAPHPSPFSARTGFFGCKHFSASNELLKKSGIMEIDWNVPDLL